MSERTIQPLRGPDRVRKRPAVMFGSDGPDGVISAIKQVFNVFISEALVGTTKNISIIIHEDNSISIQSKDRGLLIEETLIDEKPAWYNVFCELNSSLGLFDEQFDLYGRKDTEELKYNSCMYYSGGTGVAATQLASEYMNVTVVRDGMKKTLNFKKGYPCSDLHKENCDEETYTYIHFKPDPEVFSDINITTEKLTKMMLEVAITIRELTCELTDMRNGQNVLYCYENGIEDRCKELIGNNESTRIYTKQIEARGRDRYNCREYDAISTVALAFVATKGKVECYHNHRNLKYGGTHLQELQSRIKKCLARTLLSKFQELNDDTKLFDMEICYEDMLNYFVIVVETACSGRCTSNWGNGTQESITNKMITDMTADLINDDFDFYLRVNASKILKCLKEIYGKRTSK